MSVPTKLWTTAQTRRAWSSKHKAGRRQRDGSPSCVTAGSASRGGGRVPRPLAQQGHVQPQPACHFRRASGSHEKRWACVGLPCSWIPWKGCAQSSCRHPCPRATMCKTSARLQRQKVGTHSQPLPARLRRQTAQQVASGQSWAQKQDCSAGAIPCGTAPRTRRQGRPRAVQGCVKGSCQGTEAAKHARGACGVLRVRLPRHTNQQP